MAARKRAGMPLPGKTEQSDAPPLPPSRRPPPPLPTEPTEEEDSDEDYEQPSNPNGGADESQEFYDEFDFEGPPVDPYNPSASDHQPEIYDEFELDEPQDVYEDPDEKPVSKTRPPPSTGKAPPLPPLDNRRRGSTPLPAPPSEKRALPQPPTSKAPSIAPVDQDIYEQTDDITEQPSFESESEAPLPPPPPPGRSAKPKPPTPQRKTEEKKVQSSSASGGIGVQISDIQGALKGLKKVSVGEKAVDDKNVKNEINQTKKMSPGNSFEDKMLLFGAKNNADKNQDSDKNNNNSRPILPNQKPKPLIPKVNVEKESSKTNSVANSINIFGAVKPDLSSKPQPTPKPPLKPKSENEFTGVRTVQLTPRKLPVPPPPEEFPPPPDMPDDNYDEEIYDDATSQDLDPLYRFPWYHGMVERKEVERLLQSVGKDGTFLVRKSTKGIDQPYTMAVLYQNRVSNLKVRLRTDKRVALGEAKENEISFKDVEGLVEHHRKHPVLLIGTHKGEVTLLDSPRKS